VGGLSLRRGGDRSRSHLVSRTLSASRSRNGDLGADAGSLADLSSTSAALLGWMGGGEERREVAVESLPEASFDAYIGRAGEGDLRLLHVSAVGGSARSRLGEGERRLKSRVSRVSRVGENRRAGGLQEVSRQSKYTRSLTVPIDPRTRLFVPTRADRRAHAAASGGRCIALPRRRRPFTWSRRAGV
jgi:hypothetical protein